MTLSNPLRMLWRFMRGDDIRESNERAVAAYTAAAHAAAGAGNPSPEAPAPDGERLTRALSR